jgi:hypothetical protein
LRLGSHFFFVETGAVAGGIGGAKLGGGGWMLINLDMSEGRGRRVASSISLSFLIMAELEHPSLGGCLIQ